MYNIFNQTTSTVELNHANIIDFDVSQNGEFIVYSIWQPLFKGNSDIFLKDLKNNQTIQLTTYDYTASFNAILLPNSSKIFYVNRIYNIITKK